MRKLLFAVFASGLLFACAPEKISFQQLQDRNGIYFLMNEEKPFTGDVISYSNGRKEFEGRIENGLRTGTWTWFHPSGARKTEGKFTDGVREGNWVSWKENGEQEKLEIYKSGKLLTNTNSGITSDTTAIHADTTVAAEQTAATAQPAIDPSKKTVKAEKATISTTVAKKEKKKSEPEAVLWERLRGGAVKFLDGIPYTGPVIKYQPNGRLELEGEFYRGHRSGKWTFYDFYGNVRNVRYY